uniref:Uncharacterized protein n=1 Tax=Oryza glumipatula TaxID=40148 RepID=A0A0D9ZFY6_9ORYZ
MWNRVGFRGGLRIVWTPYRLETELVKPIKQTADMKGLGFLDHTRKAWRLELGCLLSRLLLDLGHSFMLVRFRIWRGYP